MAVDPTQAGNPNFPNSPILTFRIIVIGFGIVGALAAMAIFAPDNTSKVEAIVTGVTGGIFGFMAGRSKA